MLAYAIQIDNVYTVGGVDVTLSKFNTQKYNIKCAKNIGCTYSMCEQS